MPDEKVLLIDDEKEFTEVLAERMEARGLKVTTADSGPDAIKRVTDENFDAIVLDLFMPGMDGIETLKQLLQKNPDLQIILLTGRATVEKGVEAIKLGAMDFIEKPAEFEKLMELINKAAAKKMLLVEKNMEEKMSAILKQKGW
jgi:DNA-binding NtrC family response regulator